MWVNWLLDLLPSRCTWRFPRSNLRSPKRPEKGNLSVCVPMVGGWGEKKNFKKKEDVCLCTFRFKKRDENVCLFVHLQMRVLVFQAGRLLEPGETVIVLKITKKFNLLTVPQSQLFICHYLSDLQKKYIYKSDLQVHPGIQGFHCPIARIETGKT